MTTEVTITVPATTANIGPGFDCLGAALGLHNRFRFRSQPSTSTEPTVTIQIEGLESDRVSTTSDNLVYTSFLKLYDHIKQTPPCLDIKIDLGVPLSRGLGSSATAIIGGLMGANALADNPLDQSEVLEIAIALEGHPDNVAPALLGNCQLAIQRSNGQYLLRNISWSDAIVPVIAIPNFELSTLSARSVLPTTCSYSDAIFNASHLAMLIHGLSTGDIDGLSTALCDRLHQPYREGLIQGYRAVKTAALDSGACGVVISGAGPSLLALAPQHMADSVAEAMKLAWAALSVEAIAQVVELDTQGTRMVMG